MDKNKIAVVGDPSSVMIFKAVGFDVFYAVSYTHLRAHET